jgi:ATP-binding cassette subfamily B protein
VRHDCHIEFDSVSFSYNKVRENVKDVSFRLGKGETLGIIGATGSGKSTLINLLLRMYDPDEGCVRIDGKDIRSLSSDELRCKFGVVFQNDFIMADSIYENVRYFREIERAEIERAARVACAEEYISNYPEGFDHVLAQNGNDLSGGQRQRLLITRALAQDPEILILDDASSALDYATDAKFRAALAEEYGDTTQIIVTQRVSSVMHAELIVMLDDGQIVCMGTHAELMESCEQYRKIADIQLCAMSAGGEANG